MGARRGAPRGGRALDALTATLLAAAIAWASILLARVVPFERVWGARGLRIVASASLANVALVVLGAPLEGWRAAAIPLAAALAVAGGRLARAGWRRVRARAA